MQKQTITNLLTTRMSFVVRNEENLEEKAHFNFSYAQVFLLLFSLFIILFFLAFFLVTTLLAKWYDPRAESYSTNKQLIELSQKVDSLDAQVVLKDKYINQVKALLEGKEPIGAGTASATAESNNTTQSSAAVDLNLEPFDSVMSKEFEKIDYQQVAYKSVGGREDLRQMSFFTPISGVISQKYNVKGRHYGVDIVAKKDEPVRCTADGTVIMSSWTQDAGYVIAVQHKNQVISFYKHNSVLYKKIGETVKAGDVIAVIGNSGELTNGPHLHFELWYNGNPVNPEDFIYF